VEKANRTIFYLHVSSWITRDLDTKKRGGGILTERLFAVSLSGLSEHLDEAFSSVVAMNGGLGMTEDRWCHIRHISENPHMARFGYLS
jgi:hypothetical protein